MTHELRFERLIDASPETVFDAFTTAAGQRAFYGRDEPGWVVDTTCELRVGGLWSVTFGPREAPFRHDHVFRAVERPHRLAFTTRESRPDRPPFGFEVEITFAERDGGCVMTMRQSGFTSTEERDRHGTGLAHAFDRLERAIHDDGGARPWEA